VAFLGAGRDVGQAGNTLKLCAVAIRFLHRAAGLPSSTDTAEVSETMAGIRRGAQKKRAATTAVLRELLAPIPDDLRGHRDRALLLVGFAGALRRSELAAITLADGSVKTWGVTPRARLLAGGSVRPALRH